MAYEKVPGTSPEVEPPDWFTTSPAPRSPMTQAEQSEIAELWSGKTSAPQDPESVSE